VLSTGEFRRYQLSNANEQLAEFQAVLLEKLDRYVDASDILRALHDEECTWPFKEWIKQIEPHMLEIGAELVKKWGAKNIL
jgi:hypothetical protein